MDSNCQPVLYLVDSDLADDLVAVVLSEGLDLLLEGGDLLSHDLAEVSGLGRGQPRRNDTELSIALKLNKG